MGSRGLKQWLWRHISHMGEMRDSDWSRENLLRSDWLLPIGAIMTTISYHGRRKGKVGSPEGKTWRTSNRRNKKHKRSENYSQTHRFRRYNVEPFERCWANIQGHPTDLFLTISVLQRSRSRLRNRFLRRFCWLETEVSAVLLGSKVLNLRSRIYQMYQKFLLEVFYPSNLLEIFFVRELCARLARGVVRW